MTVCVFVVVMYSVLYTSFVLVTVCVASTVRRKAAIAQRLKTGVMIAGVRLYTAGEVEETDVMRIAGTHYTAPLFESIYRAGPPPSYPLTD